VAGVGGGRVLAVDDDEDILAWLRVKLPPRELEVVCCEAGSEALALIDREPFDVVLTDLGMKEMDGLELCDRVVSNFPAIPVLLLTANGTVDAAVAAMRAGAFDFIVKPLEVETLLFALDRAVRNRRLRQEVGQLRRQAELAGGFGEIWGKSPAMKQIFGFLDQVANLNTSVLITGESGTGKELVARALHRHGRRRDGPFVAVNCAALPEALLEAELFGHVRGAFTGAQTARAGLFASASGGTLFLDEIAELPMPLQPKLLRALQERQVRPVGADREVSFDTRVVAATNRDLESGVDEGRFRADLFFRLNVLPVHLPPLRARGTDVLFLAQRFVDRFAGEMGKAVKGLAPAVGERLLAYAWPGNIRELQNAIERAVALTKQEQLTVEDLPERVRSYQKSHIIVAGDDPTELASLAEVERRYVLTVLDAAGGNKTDASQILGIGRKTLYRKLQSYGVLDRDAITPSGRRDPGDASFRDGRERDGQAG
jgi:two-component system response regulator HydG